MNMVFDYYENVPGSPFCQPEIALVLNTDDIAGGFTWAGTQATDARRGSHFSIISPAVNGGASGYSWRPIGFSAVDTNWNWPVNGLKRLLDKGYPIIIHSIPGPLDSLYQQDGSPFNVTTDTTEIGHSRVLVGYDDTLVPPIFIMHDPWSQGPPTGAFIYCAQGYFWRKVWPPTSRFLFLAPWEVSSTHADTLGMNDTAVVKAKVHYAGPAPLNGYFQLAAASAVVKLILPQGLSFAAGDSAVHGLPGINLTGDIDSTEWSVVVSDSAFQDSFVFLARGIVSSSSVSYPGGYSDSIGGRTASPFVVADLEAPSVDVVYPDGGETILGGTVDTFMWIASDNKAVDSIPILATSNAGATWDTIARGEENDSSFATNIPSVNSDSCLIAVFAFDSGLNVGSDTSDSFFTIWTDVFPPTVTVLYPNGGEILVAGTQDSVRWTAFDTSGVDSLSVLCSTDSGTTWDTLCTGETNDSVASVTWPMISSDKCLVKVIAFDPGLLQGSDTSDSLFEIRMVGVLEGSHILRERFCLWPNEPNPFGLNTTIRFSLGPGALNAALRICDLAGRSVRTIQLDAARRNHEYVWDGNDEHGAPVPSGIYFCNLECGSDVQSMKMVVVR
jgi:hypothetical protein